MKLKQPDFKSSKTTVSKKKKKTTPSSISRSSKLPLVFLQLYGNTQNVSYFLLKNSSDYYSFVLSQLSYLGKDPIAVIDTVFELLLNSIIQNRVRY